MVDAIHAPVRTPETEAMTIVQGWLLNLEAVISGASALGLERVIRPDGWWRDLLSLTWDIRSFVGPSRKIFSVSPRC